MNINSLNVIQKLSFIAFSTIIIVSIFLHNPFSGYIVKSKPFNEYESKVRYVPCSQEEKNALRSRFEEARKKGVYDDAPKENTDKFINTMVDKCSESVPYKIKATGELLPFSEWKSSNPVFPWFGFVSNILQLIVAVGLIFGIAFHLFRNVNETLE